MPHFSLLTPSILRESLVGLCYSVDKQTCTDWEHIVVVDGVADARNVLGRIEHPQRKIIQCDQAHKDFGHSCCHFAYPHLTGEYIWRLDDDNYLADENVLRELLFVTGSWAIFPILRLGQRFFSSEPGMGGTDSGSFIVRREFGRWPHDSAYSADGNFVEALKRAHPYQVLSELRPLMVMPGIGHGG